MNFGYASSSAGPSGFDHYEEEPCTSASLSNQVSTSVVHQNYEWKLPKHFANLINGDENDIRPFIYNRTDPNIQCDTRAFYNCMEYEETLQPNYHYFTAVQEHITPYHREQAVEWIYDVAKEENCDGDVFLLAVSLIDRFLSVLSILKTDLQMVAGVSLFIASKLKAPIPLTLSKIEYYSAKICPIDMIIQWEMLIVTTLQWETESPTAFSFFDHLASRIPQIHSLRPEFQRVVQKCQRMHKLATLFPSMQCAIALYYVSSLPHQNKQLAASIKNLLGIEFQLEVNLLDSYLPMVKRCLNDAPIYAPEEVEKAAETASAPAPTQAPEQEEEEEEEEQADVEHNEEGPEEYEDEGEYEDKAEDENEEEDEEDDSVSKEEEPIDDLFTTPEEITAPLFDQIPESDKIPLTPLNDSGFSSDVSSPASSEKKRRRSSEWFDDDISPPKIFKSS